MRINYLLAASSARAHITDIMGIPGRDILRMHIKELSRLRGVDQITLLRAGFPAVDAPGFYDIDDLKQDLKAPLEILDPPDMWFSYSSWIQAIQFYRDRFDYYILMEDDYYPAHENFVKEMIRLHQEKLPNGGYLNSFTTDHAAVSNGIVDSKTFLSIINRTSDLFLAIAGGQRAFSNLFTKEQMADYTDQYRCLFWHKSSGFIEETHNGGLNLKKDLINPIQYLRLSKEESWPKAIV